jgi:hypothetical protein
VPKPITIKNTAILWSRETQHVGAKAAPNRESRQARRARERREAKASPPAVRLLTDTQTRGFIRGLVESRQWWILPWMNQSAAELSMEIERRFYASKAEGDFVAFLGPAPITAARKCRMSREQLADLLAELCTAQGWTSEQWREAIAEHDILVTVGEADSDSETLAHLMAWHDWLEGR